MAENLIEISTEQLQSDINKMTEQQEEALKNTDQMFSTMKELDSMWDGVANEAFQAQFEADYEAMKELCEEVRTLISCMEFAKKEYDQCESAVADAVAAIRVEEVS